MNKPLLRAAVYVALLLLPFVTHAQQPDSNEERIAKLEGQIDQMNKNGKKKDDPVTDFLYAPATGPIVGGLIALIGLLIVHIFFARKFEAFRRELETNSEKGMASFKIDLERRNLLSERIRTLHSLGDDAVRDFEGILNLNTDTNELDLVKSFTCALASFAKYFDFQKEVKGSSGKIKDLLKETNLIFSGCFLDISKDQDTLDSRREDIKKDLGFIKEHLATLGRYPEDLINKA